VGNRLYINFGIASRFGSLFEPLRKSGTEWKLPESGKPLRPQSTKNQLIHFMPSLIRKLFHKSEAPNDGLTQPQREAVVDLLNYCMYADNLVFLAGDRLITDTVAKFNWDPKIPFDQFDARSVSNARNASESQVYRDQFLASIKDRLDTPAAKGQALDLCQELFVADGAL
jgi:hypothetical protein